MSAFSSLPIPVMIVILACVFVTIITMVPWVLSFFSYGAGRSLSVLLRFAGLLLGRSFGVFLKRLKAKESPYVNTSLDFSSRHASAVDWDRPACLRQNSSWTALFS